MHILLPPSETKRLGGGGSFVLEDLAFHTELGDTRAQVREALEQVSGDEHAAVKALKLGKNNVTERLLNLELDSSGVMPAIERYTGVLYDALDVASLPTDSREWLNTNVYIQSALFGIVSAANLIPAYRLSASSRLPALGATLKAVWQAAHAQLHWEQFGFTLDLRSQDYAQLAPMPAGRGHYLKVAQRTEHGEVRALNHFNKAAKGHLVHQLAQVGDQITNVAELCDWAHSNSLEITLDPSSPDLTLITDLGAPQNSVKAAAR